MAEAPPAHASSLRLLLDTHTWIWWQTDDGRLGKNARRLILESDDASVSAASVWEMSIKAGMGRLKVPRNLSVSEHITASGFEVLSVSGEHADAVRHLPLLHRDPFDRMLVAQALVDGLTILTADTAVAAYPVPVIDASA